MDDSEFFIEMEKVINKWMNVPQTVKIFDKNITGKPHFLSITYKEKDIYIKSILNGEEIESGNVVKNTGYSLKAMIGDEEQGFGSGRFADDQIPRKINILTELIDKDMDSALKTALEAYLSEISENISIQENGFLRKNSKDCSDEYFEKESDANHNLFDDKIISMLKDFTEKLSNMSHIEKSTSSIAKSQTKRFFIDSENRKIKDQNIYSRLSTGIEVYNKNNFTIPYGSLITLTKNLKLNDNILEQNLEEILKHSFELVNAKIPISNQYPIIMGNSATGTLFHESIGAHLLSGKYIVDKTSTVFKGKINTQIVPDFITLIDNPLRPNGFGSYLYDEEGIKAKKLTLIKSGILKNYLHDRESASYFDKKSNGHSRAEWVNGLTEIGIIGPTFPEPRVSNLEIISSNSVEDEILFEIMKQYCKDNKIEAGIYLESGAGQVDVESSEFRLYPSKAWKIYNNGKKELITNFYVVGNAFELLNQIAITGNSYKSEYGICGADSGGVPTEEIAPMAFIPRVTIQAIEPEKYTKRLI